MSTPKIQIAFTNKIQTERGETLCNVKLDTCLKIKYKNDKLINNEKRIIVNTLKIKCKYKIIL